jgi:hypothetical protein
MKAITPALVVGKSVVCDNSRLQFTVSSRDALKYDRGDPVLVVGFATEYGFDDGMTTFRGAVPTTRETSLVRFDRQ